MTNREIVTKHPIAIFVALAYGLTWLIVLPLVLDGIGILSLNVSPILHYLAPAGPALAAMIVTYALATRDGFNGLVKRITKWRVGPKWLGISIFSVWLFYVAAGLIQLLLGQPWPDVSQFGNVRYLPYLTFIGAWALWIFSFGLGEETGWRGFLLPRLQIRFNALKSAILLSFIWAAWHLPFFFYNENLQAMGLIGTIMWIIGLMFGSIVLTWIFNSTQGSVLMTAAWHGTYNLFTAAEGQATGLVAPVITIFVMILVLAVIAYFKPENLSSKERQQDLLEVLPR